MVGHVERTRKRSLLRKIKKNYYIEKICKKSFAEAILRLKLLLLKPRRGKNANKSIKRICTFKKLFCPIIVHYCFVRQFYEKKVR